MGGEDHRARGEVGIEAAGKAATQDELVRFALQRGVQSALGILPPDAGDQEFHSLLRNEFRLLLDGETEQHPPQAVRPVLALSIRRSQSYAIHFFPARPPRRIWRDGPSGPTTGWQ